ncbi:hypothetical protein [Croceicoccus gelatinilyticus]|uniref:hypothetical protein n=1 Tax=Croceicoccus gelatinilyticus TaxID=2835536 RepID=UPI001BCCAF3A|nr:hypothetical protein [Croceicoccus gelatinilyticus]MBS7671538.1 hypothetical protein [Croceicoccus gelatinilyticus]
MIHHSDAPEGFTPVTQGVPGSDKPVLAIRIAECGSRRFEMLTACYHADRKFSQWRTIGNDAVTDSGLDVHAWRYDPVLEIAR